MLFAAPAYVTQYDHRAPVMSLRKNVKFPEGRIRALRDERLALQKKTFTKWINSFLLKVLNLMVGFGPPEGGVRRVIVEHSVCLVLTVVSRLGVCENFVNQPVWRIFTKFGMAGVLLKLLEQTVC